MNEGDLAVRAGGTTWGRSLVNSRGALWGQGKFSLPVLTSAPTQTDGSRSLTTALPVLFQSRKLVSWQRGIAWDFLRSNAYNCFFPCSVPEFRVLVISGRNLTKQRSGGVGRVVVRSPLK